MCPELFFITLNWNSTDYFKAMFKSVESTTPQRHKWIILDNGSRAEELDAMTNFIKTFMPDAKLAMLDLAGLPASSRMDEVTDPSIRSASIIVIRLPVNVGCVLAHNLCFAMARYVADAAPHEIVMLDTDVEVYEADWLTKVWEWLVDKPGVGIVGLEHTRGEACAGAVFLDPSGNWYLHDDQLMAAQPERGESVGLGMALIRWPILEVGLRFDTGFKIYYKQDDDLCFAARSELGLDAWAYPIDMVHWGSSTLKANNWDVADGARDRSAFDQIKQANQKYFAAKWRRFLRPRRATMEQERKHLDDMWRLMAEERNQK